MLPLRDLLGRPSTPLIGVALVTVALCAVHHRLHPTLPEVQDEFSYLLAADTFAHGRLTNPPHLLRGYLDVPHVLQEPTYQSKYPPGQGLLLAFGQLATGRPLAGVWLGLALASAAVCWMLRAWLSAGWAVLGGVLAATSGTVLTSWGGSFMGGGLAMLGGALLVGALARGVERPRPRHGVVLALGLVVLAMTRPFEGLVASLPAAAVLLARIVRRPREASRSSDLRSLLLPLLVVLALAGAWLAYYNARVTGSPWRLPYQTYLAQHEADVFTHPLADVIGEERMARIRRPLPERLAHLAVFHLGGWPVLALPVLLALPALARRRWSRYALIASAATLVAASLTLGAEPHYSAPIAALVLALLVESLAVISGWIRWRGAVPLVVGLFLIAWLSGSFRLVAADAVSARRAWISSQSAMPPGVPVPAIGDYERRTERDYWRWFAQIGMPVRQHHLDRLVSDGDRHLVLVVYVAGSTRYREWAYNGADVDRQQVVWARWLPEQPLWPLLAYYRDRRVWYVVPERDPWELLPLPTERIGTWHVRQHGPAVAQLVPSPQPTGPVRLEILRPGEATWHVQLEHALPPLHAGRGYTVSFGARAEAPRGLVALVSRAHPPWGALGPARSFSIGPDWETFSYRFDAESSEPLARLVFNAGTSDVAVEISDVVATADP
jgi:hypothetical protein